MSRGRLALYSTVQLRLTFVQCWLETQASTESNRHGTNILVVNKLKEIRAKVTVTDKKNLKQNSYMQNRDFHTYTQC